MRFGPGVDAPVAWLGALPGPVWACYEAGPTGYGLYRAAVAAGIRIDVIAPGKTPRSPSEQVKTDRRWHRRHRALLNNPCPVRRRSVSGHDHTRPLDKHGYISAAGGLVMPGRGWVVNGSRKVRRFQEPEKVRHTPSTFIRQLAPTCECIPPKMSSWRVCPALCKQTLRDGVY
jgi:hypothetical protein